MRRSWLPAVCAAGLLVGGVKAQEAEIVPRLTPAPQPAVITPRVAPNPVQVEDVGGTFRIYQSWPGHRPPLAAPSYASANLGNGFLIAPYTPTYNGPSRVAQQPLPGTLYWPYPMTYYSSPARNSYVPGRPIYPRAGW